MLQYSGQSLACNCTKQKNGVKGCGSGRFSSVPDYRKKETTTDDRFPCVSQGRYAKSKPSSKQRAPGEEGCGRNRVSIRFDRRRQIEFICKLPPLSTDRDGRGVFSAVVAVAALGQDQLRQKEMCPDVCVSDFLSP